MRVALAHDWLTGMRGGEKVLERIAARFPDAPIYTLIHFPGTVSAEIEAHRIESSWLARVATPESYRSFLPLFPLAVRGLDVSAFDLVVSTSHCAIKSLRVAEGALHVCYCHTPMRYAWDQFDAYFGRHRLGPVRHAAMRLIMTWLRDWDRATQDRVDHYVANSRYVAGRIRDYYGREALVLPPPVDTDRFVPSERAAEDYYLIVSALSPYKRVDLAVDAFRERRERLVVVGAGPEEQRLRARGGANVSFRGRVDDAELVRLYQGCRGFVLPGIEDAGIAPIEAMACGRPAIVLNQGGAPEAVIEERTGVCFEAPTPAALGAAVDRAERLSFNTGEIRRHAERYDRAVFDRRFGDLLDRLLAGRGNRATGGTPGSGGKA